MASTKNEMTNESQVPIRLVWIPKFKIRLHRDPNPVSEARRLNQPATAHIRLAINRFQQTWRECNPLPSPRVHLVLHFNSETSLVSLADPRNPFPCLQIIGRKETGVSKRSIRRSSVANSKENISGRAGLKGVHAVLQPRGQHKKGAPAKEIQIYSNFDGSETWKNNFS